MNDNLYYVLYVFCAVLIAFFAKGSSSVKFATGVLFPLFLLHAFVSGVLEIVTSRINPLLTQKTEEITEEIHESQPNGMILIVHDRNHSLEQMPEQALETHERTQP